MGHLSDMYMCLKGLGGGGYGVKWEPTILTLFRKMEASYRKYMYCFRNEHSTVRIQIFLGSVSVTCSIAAAVFTKMPPFFWQPGHFARKPPKRSPKAKWPW